MRIVINAPVGENRNDLVCISGCVRRELISPRNKQKAFIKRPEPV